jgi:hypothetical protein
MCQQVTSSRNGPRMEGSGVRGEEWFLQGRQVIYGLLKND